MLMSRSVHGGRFPENPAFVQNLGETVRPEVAEKISFWVGGLILSFGRYTDRQSLLELTDTTQRLTQMSTTLEAVVERLDEGNIRGCRII